MINFLSLMRPSGQLPSAQVPAGAGGADNSAAADSQTLSIFAGLIQSFLFNGADAPPAAPDPAVPGDTFAGFAPKGKAEEKIQATGLAEEIEPRPLKLKSKDGAESAPVVVLVPQSMLKQVASNMPVAAAAWGVSASLGASGAAGGSGDAMTPPDDLSSGPASAETTPTAANGITGGPTATWGQVNFAQPFVPVQADGDMLLSLLKEIPPPGMMPARAPESPSVSGVTGAPAGGAEVKTPVPDLAALLKGELKPGALDVPAPVGVKEDIQVPSVPQPQAQPLVQPLVQPQVHPQVPDAIVTPPGAALPLPEIAPALVPGAITPQPKTAVVTPRSDSKEPRAVESAAPVEESPAPGFFTGVVPDVNGIAPRTGERRGAQYAQADTPALSSPVNDSFAGRPSQAFADVQLQPAARPVSGSQDGSQADAVPAAAAEAVRPSREQSEATPLRTSQQVLASQVVPDKTDAAPGAAPVRDLPSAYAPLPAEVSQRIADQVVQNLKLQVDGTTSEIKMTLKPPSLGQLQLSIHVEDSKMAAQIDVSQAVVKAALEAHMPQLRMALQEHGIEVQRIDVMLPEQSLQRDGTGTNGERTGRRGSRRSLSGDDVETLQGVKDMGYNTIELIM